MKIKVRQQKNGLGDVQYQNTKSIGVHAADIFSASEVENNPSKYEVVESTQTGKGILRESFPEHKMGRGWTKVPRKPYKPTAEEIKRYAHSSVPRKAKLHEDDAAEVQGTEHSLVTRKFAQGDHQQVWTRANVKGNITVFLDGSWGHYIDNGKPIGRGKSHSDLESYLDSSYPVAVESVRVLAPESAAKLTEAEARVAVKRAHRILGIDMPEKSTEDALIEAWSKLCGGDLSAGKLAKEGKF